MPTDQDTQAAAGDADPPPQADALPRDEPAPVPRVSMPPPGTPGGIEAHELTLGPLGAASARRPGPPLITVVDYCPEQYELQQVHDIPAFLASHRPPWSQVRWINIDGLSQLDVIQAFAVKYQLHPLAIEDVVHRIQAPKVEDYPGSADQPGRLFVVARGIEQEDGRLRTDQVSLFLGRNTLLSFHEVHSGELDPIYLRVRTPGSRLRQHDVSFLLYVLLDRIVDEFFPILERYSGRLEEVEQQLLDRPDHGTLQQIHGIKRELLLMRRAAWPLRELIIQLQRERHECLSPVAQTYLRDVHDHCIQIIDLVETYREIAGGLAETYISVVSNRTNDIMKVLTIIGTVFIPLTFLAGVYGMNMPIPENSWVGTYPVFWLVCISLAVGMLAWFRRRGWF